MSSKLCVLVIFLCIQIRLSAIATGSPQPALPPIEQIDPLETDSCTVKDQSPSGPTVLPEIDLCAVDQSQNDLQSSEPMVLSETDSRAIDQPQKDQQSCESMHLSEIDSPAIDQLQKDLQSSEPTVLPEIDLCAVDQSQNDLQSSEPMVLAETDSHAIDQLQKDLQSSEPMVLLETDSRVVDQSQKDLQSNEPMVLAETDSHAIDQLQKDLQSSEPMVLSETDSRVVDQSQKDLQSNEPNVLSEIDSHTIDQSQKVQHSSKPMIQSEIHSHAIDQLQKVQHSSEPMVLLESNSRAVDKLQKDLQSREQMLKNPYWMGEHFLRTQTTDVLKTDTKSNEQTDASKIDHSNFNWTDLLLKRQLPQNKSIFDDSEEDDGFDEYDEFDDSEDFMMENSSDSSTSFDDINFLKKRYFNPVDSTWQKITAKTLYENYREFFMPVDSTTQDESTDIIFDENIIEEHDWTKVAKKELSDDVVCKKVDGEDDNSLFKTLSFWITGKQTFDNQFRNILNKFMRVDSKVLMYFKTAVKRDVYLTERENGKKNAMGAHKEIQCAAFLLNTSIMVYNKYKDWTAYYKSLDNKIIGDEEQCIYIRSSGRTRYDIVVDVKELDVSFEGLHEQLFLGQPPGYERYNEFTKNIENPSVIGKRKQAMLESLDRPRYPNTKLETWLEQPYSWHKMMMRKKLNIMSETPKAEDFETNRFFYPVNGDWQLNITKKLGLPCVQQHENIDRKKLNRFANIESIIGDGNCLFRSLSHWVTGSEKYYAEMRAHIANFIKTDSQMDTYFGGPKKIEEYFKEKDMAKNGVWGTEKEVIAAATLFQTSIYVLYKHEGIHEWVLYNKNYQNPVYPGEDERCIYIRNRGLSHYDVVKNVADQILTPQSNS